MCYCIPGYMFCKFVFPSLSRPPTLALINLPLFFLKRITMFVHTSWITNNWHWIYWTLCIIEYRVKKIKLDFNRYLHIYKTDMLKLYSLRGRTHAFEIHGLHVTLKWICGGVWIGRYKLVYISKCRYMGNICVCNVCGLY